jgi:hypothetical protein
MLPTVNFFGHEISRLIIGGNTFSGNSHVSREIDAEMMDYFTTDVIKNTLKKCLVNGINTMQLRSDAHITRIIRELRNEGFDMHWVAQTAPEILFRSNINVIMRYNPIAIYHHGSVTDNWFQEKKFGELKENLKIMRDTGKPVGLGTHLPEVIDYAEEHLDVDFYMACVYNPRRKPHVSSAITGVANSDEVYEEDDRVNMLKKIREIKKPCLAFKILAATRNCNTPGDVEAAFKRAFDEIKPIDTVVVGMFPKYSDQIKHNADIVRRICK